MGGTQRPLETRVFLHWQRVVRPAIAPEMTIREPDSGRFGMIDAFPV